MNKKKMIGAIGVFIFLALIAFLGSLKTFDEEREEEAISLEYIDVYLTGEVFLTGDFKVPSEWKLIDLLNLVKYKDTADLQSIDLMQPLIANKTYHIPSIKNNQNEEEYVMVNINFANYDELKKLDLSDDIINAIILYRATHYFSSIEEICEVDGIGPKTYEKIKTHIFV